MKDSKYLVFKRKKFIERHGTAKVSEALTDAVVIRTRDRFAAPALQAYYDAISNTIEVLEELGIAVPPDLDEVRDYFFHAASAARTSPSQLPTP